MFNSLEERAGNATHLTGVIPKLAQLLRNDPHVEAAYLCTEHVVQMYKLPQLCGYRNIQVLYSTVAGPSQPRQLSVLEIQNLIEQAWDAGFNSHGRLATGGVKGTTKHIGTSEAEAFFLNLGITCTGRAFSGQQAWIQLLDSVEIYFTMTSKSSTVDKVYSTGRPPIFLQRPNHSVTIVGLEKMLSGKRRLVTFDPAWNPPSKICKPLTEADLSGWSSQFMLRRYRKSVRYLKRFQAFETLEINLYKA